MAFKLNLLQFLNGIFLVIYLLFLNFDKNNFLFWQINIPLSFIWFNKKDDLRKYIIKKIFDTQIDKK